LRWLWGNSCWLACKWLWQTCLLHPEGWWTRCNLFFPLSLWSNLLNGLLIKRLSLVFLCCSL
jgi:hypothetical protein